MKVGSIHCNFNKPIINSKKLWGAIAGAVLLAATGGNVYVQSKTNANTGVYGYAMVKMASSSAVQENLSTYQENAAKAKANYIKSPVGSSEEAELQKTYIQSVLNWANAALNKPNATEAELDKVIDEVRYVHKYKAQGVTDLVNKAKALLPKLNDKMAVYDAPRKAAIDKKLEGIFDESAANALAQASRERAADREKSMGLCAKYVRFALQDSETIGSEEIMVESAKDLDTPYLNSGVFTQIDVKSKRDLENLPAGCVVVWQNGPGFGNAFAKHGHVFVTQGGGKATTDYNQWIKDYGTDFKNGVTKGRSGQAKYLNRYIKWAKAIIEDKNASEADVRDLVARLTEVPDNNKAVDIQPMVQRTQELLQQIKTVYNIE